jgi:hypothetical protein
MVLRLNRKTDMSYDPRIQGGDVAEADHPFSVGTDEKAAVERKPSQLLVDTWWFHLEVLVIEACCGWILAQMPS